MTFLRKQEGTGSAAPAEGWDLSKSVDSSSKSAGKKAKYIGTDFDRWVGVVVRACESSFLTASIFSGK